ASPTFAVDGYASRGRLRSLLRMASDGKHLRERGRELVRVRHVETTRRELDTESQAHMTPIPKRTDRQPQYLQRARTESVPLIVVDGANHPARQHHYGVLTIDDPVHVERHWTPQEIPFARHHAPFR